MRTLTLFYATNRNHLGRDRWHPSGYGARFSQDGIENLRFGRISVDADDAVLARHLATPAHDDHGDGESLAAYLATRARRGRIEAYPETLDPEVSDTQQARARLGSQAMFRDLKAAMQRRSDVLVYLHGFNVHWADAVGAALALQEMQNRPGVGDPAQAVLVVLFTWPSDGLALPFVSYKSDRTEAQGSGYAVGRGLLKLRDFLAALTDRPGGRPADTAALCGQDLHLLCHSMGNYVLQHALARVQAMHTGSGLPRLFEHIFLCAADVDETALEQGQALGELHRLARGISVYHNRGDLAMYVSDYSKGNPERLGTNGAAHPGLLHNKIHQVDCTPIVRGLVEHGYYLWGPIASDLRASIDGVPQDSGTRRRTRSDTLPNVWQMV